MSSRRVALPITAHLRQSGLLAEHPLRVIDAGSRGGPEAHWEYYGDQLELIGFEPEAEECARLNAAARSRSGRRETYYPIGLDRTRGQRTLWVTQFADASSLLPPNLPFVSRFPHAGAGTVMGRVTVATTDLDTFLDEAGVGPVDFLKLDVEGVALPVLEGAQRLLASGLLGLSVEVFLQPYRQGESLFSEVDPFLRARGFSLFDLKLERWRRQTLVTEAPHTWYNGGQVMWAQCLYLRDLADPAHCVALAHHPSPRRSLWKLASLAEVFDLADFSLEVLQAGAAAGWLSAADTAALPALTASLHDRLRAQRAPGGGVRWRWLRRWVPRRLVPALRRLAGRRTEGARPAP